MSTGLALLIFAVSLGATLVAAAVFAERLDVIGHRLELPESLIGVLTAAGADAPELSSAVVALATGANAVGLGVVVGSNVFNIAAMLGLSAVVVGRVRLAPEALALEGGVALAVTVIVALLVFGVLPAWATVLLVLLVLVPYAIVISVAEGDRPPVVAEAVAAPAAVARRQGPAAARRAARGDRPDARDPAGGRGDRARQHRHGAHGGDARRPLGVPDVVVGAVLLAVLTSLPNAYTGVRLGVPGAVPRSSARR